MTAQRADVTPPLDKDFDTTCGIYRRQDGKLVMGNKTMQFDRNIKTLTVVGTVYDFTPGLHALIMLKHQRADQWNSHDYQAYKSLSAQTKVRLIPNSAGATRPHATWKYKHVLRKMVVPGDRITEESGDSEDTDTASIGDTGESSSSPSILSSDSGILSPDIPPSPAHTSSHGKAKKTKDREPFYKGYKGEGVVYLPGDINGLAKKLQLLAAEFFAGTTTVRNEFVHVLDGLLRLKQLTRKEYTNITARLAASL